MEVVPHEELELELLPGQMDDLTFHDDLQDLQDLQAYKTMTGEYKREKKM